MATSEPPPELGKTGENSRTSYKHRLQTFRQYTNENVTAHNLANAGFVYNANRNVLVCPQCRIELDAVSPMPYDPLSVHMVESQGNCSYLQARSAKGKTGVKMNKSEADCDNNSSTGQVESTSRVPDNLCVKREPQQYNLAYETLAMQRVQEAFEALPMPSDGLQGGWLNENIRFNSFNNVTLPDGVSQEKLARSGLYMMPAPAENQVACAFCNFQSNLSKHVLVNHITTSLSYTHLRENATPEQRQNIGNLRDSNVMGASVASLYEEFGIVGDGEPKHPEMATASNRQATFLTSHISDQKCDTFTEAGFYYNGELVSCFWCGCSIDGWMVEEDPWKRHAQVSPSCQYVQAKMGGEFVCRVQKDYNSTQEAGQRQAEETTKPATDVEEQEEEEEPEELEEQDDSEGCVSFAETVTPESIARIKLSLLCKICMDKCVAITFLPCGHLVTCVDCAGAMRKCPLCRGQIHGTVRIHIPSF